MKENKKLLILVTFMNTTSFELIHCSLSSTSLIRTETTKQIFDNQKEIIMVT